MKNRSGDLVRGGRRKQMWHGLHFLCDSSESEVECCPLVIQQIRARGERVLQDGSQFLACGRPSPLSVLEGLADETSGGFRWSDLRGAKETQVYLQSMDAA